jgi:hypothetical protein
VKYNTTKGFVKTSELMAENAPSSKGVPTVKGSFELQNGGNISSGFEVIQVLGSDMQFNLTAVAASDGANGDIEGGHATFGPDGVATYDDGGSCKITFKFDATSSNATVAQIGSCGDFGVSIDVSGTYAVK